MKQAETDTMSSYYYSLDFGKNWEGPFCREEIDSLVRVGLIDARTMVKEEAVKPPHFIPPSHYVGGVAAPPVNNAVTEDAYMVMKNGMPSGPYPVSYLREMMQRGEVQPGDMAWKNGMPRWVPLAAVAALAPLAMHSDAMSGLSQASVVGIPPGGEASFGSASLGGPPSLPTDVAPAAESSGFGEAVGKLVKNGIREWRAHQSESSLNPPPPVETEAEADIADVSDPELEIGEVPDMEGAMDAVELPDTDTGAGIFDFLSSFFE